MISVIGTITIVFSASHYISTMIINQGNANVGTPDCDIWTISSKPIVQHLAKMFL